MKLVKPICIAALAVAATSAGALRVEGAPLPTNVGAMKAALDSPIVQVRYGRWGGGYRGWGGGYRGWGVGYRGWGHRGWGYRGWGLGAAAVGGAIASSAYYGGDPYYGASYPYYDGGYGYGGGYASEYCPPYGGYHRGYYGW